MSGSKIFYSPQLVSLGISFQNIESRFDPQGQGVLNMETLKVHPGLLVIKIIKINVTFEVIQ